MLLQKAADLITNISLATRLLKDLMGMKNGQARTTYLKDYKAPHYLIETTELDFDLYQDHATVVSRLLFKKNSSLLSGIEDSLILHGQELVLEELSIDGKQLVEEDYQIKGRWKSVV